LSPFFLKKSTVIFSEFHRPTESPKEFSIAEKCSRPKKSKERLLEQKYDYWLNWPEGSYFRMSYYITGLFVLVSSLFSLVTDIGEALFLSAVVNIPLWLTCLLCLFLYRTLVNRRGNRSHIQWRGIVDVAYQSELERVQGWNEHYLHSIEKSLMDLQNANVELLKSWNSIAHLMPK
jgi:hypothetical protein